MSNTQKSFRVGVDFDNTIVCYDELFHRVALEQQLIAPDLPRTKGGVRQHLLDADREDDWTRLQGCVYGERMQEAEPYPGALEFFRSCRAWGVTPFIISHRTQAPYLGPHHDLHQAARDWVAGHGLYDPDVGGLTPDHVFFELSQEAKLARLIESRLHVFIDDLPEFLTRPDFPRGVERVLFDPGRVHAVTAGIRQAADWKELAEMIKGRALSK